MLSAWKLEFKSGEQPLCAKKPKVMSVTHPPLPATHDYALGNDINIVVLTIKKSEIQITKILN